MFTEVYAPRTQIVGRVVELLAQRDCVVLGVVHDAAGCFQALRRFLSIDEGEALRDDDFLRQPKQTVEHSRPGAAAVLLDRHHCRKGGVAFCGAANLHRFVAENRALIAEIRIERRLRQPHRAHFVIEQIIQELQNLRIGAVLCFVDRRGVVRRTSRAYRPHCRSRRTVL